MEPYLEQWGQRQSMSAVVQQELRDRHRLLFSSSWRSVLSWLSRCNITPQDSAPVRARGPPKSVTCEDSFKSCLNNAAAQRVLSVLAPDLLVRLAEELQVR